MSAWQPPPNRLIRPRDGQIAEMSKGEWLQRDAFACNYDGLEKIHYHVFY